MRGIELLVAALLCFIISVDGRRIGDDVQTVYEPIESRAGSSCVIHRSIDVDDDNDNNRKAKQASLGNGGVLIPSAASDDIGSSSSGSSSSGGDPSSSSSGGGSSSSSSGSSGSGGGGFPFQISSLLGGGNNRYPPLQYSGYNPSEYDDSGPNDSYVNASEGDFEESLYPQYYSGGIEYKRKDKGDKKKKKKGGNVNCIIIRKVTKKGGKKKPQKLFGFIPLSRRRRSMAKHLKALNSQ